jgi:hypothetical protein
LTSSAAALPPRLARLAEVQQTRVPMTGVDVAEWGFPTAEELPEVQELAVHGWRPLHEAPLYCLLPAAWPVAHRGWVPNRLPRVSCGGTTATFYGSVVPAPLAENGAECADDTPEREARAAGLPPPPTGRIWLIRSPWPRLPVTAVYDLIWEHAERRTGSDVVAVYHAARTVLGWDEDTAVTACPHDLRELLQQWASAGRAGEAAGPLVERRINPDQLNRFVQGSGLDEASALAWLDSLGCEPDDEAIAFITAWRAAGLPGDPPPHAGEYRGRDVIELRRWLDAGFDLYAAGRLHLAGLDTALRWRRAGFTAQDTYELLRDDPDLQPEEAHAFDAGPLSAQRRGWIYFGFDAHQAAAWAAAGLTPSQARIWRACHKTPADVRDGHRFPPELTAGKTYFAYSSPTQTEYGPLETVWDELPDPPGTRGRRARRWAHDPDPWINTD